MPDAFGALVDAFHFAESYLQEQRTASLVASLRSAALAAELHAVAAGAIPITAMYGVWIALGSGYLGARANVKREKFASGYSRGFVMGLLNWDWNHAVSRFGIQTVLHTNHFDDSLNEIGANEYVRALGIGFNVSKAFSEGYKNAYLRGLKSIKHPEKGNWTRNDQISYVISLSTVYRKHFVHL